MSVAWTKIATPRLALAALWLCTELILAVEDRGSALIALAFLIFVTVFYALTVRIVKDPAEDAKFLTARRPQRTLWGRVAIVAAALALSGYYTFVISGAIVPGGAMAVRPLIIAWTSIEAIAPWLGTSLPNFVLYALLPGALVVLLGLRFRQLGLTRPSRGTFVAGVVWVGLFVASWLYRLAIGRISLLDILQQLAHNTLSNGFSEEFLFRGLALSHLRALVRNDWALGIQALLFALFHLGASMHDEPNLLGILANVIALNMPFAYVMGLVALRTRSLALPAVVHLSIDTTGHLWSSH